MSECNIGLSLLQLPVLDIGGPQNFPYLTHKTTLTCVICLIIMAVSMLDWVCTSSYVEPISIHHTAGVMPVLHKVGFGSHIPNQNYRMTLILTCCNLHGHSTGYPDQTKIVFLARKGAGGLLLLNSFSKPLETLAWTYDAQPRDIYHSFGVLGTRLLSFSGHWGRWS